MSQFERVRGWIERWEQPGKSPDAGHERQPEEPTRTGGVCVTLRLANQIIGRGTSFSDDLQLSVQEATGRAMADAERRLPMPQDEEARREIARGIAIGVEMAGLMTPLTPEGVQDAALTLAPGIDGVAGRIGQGGATGRGGAQRREGAGDGRLEAIFPEAMLLAGIDAGRGLASIGGTLSGASADALREPSALQRELGVTFYKFRTTHLAQVRAGDAPVFLKRGARLTGSASLSADQLAAFPDRLASHLLTRDYQTGGEVRMRGSYLPIADRYEREDAAPLEVGVAGIALLTYAHTARVDHATASAAIAFVAGMIDRIETIGAAQSGMTVSPGVAALIGAMVREASASLRMTDLPPEAPGVPSERWQELQRDLDEAMVNGASSIGELPPVERAVLAWGLAMRGARTGEASHRAMASEAVRETFRLSDPISLAGMMPWLGWAELLVSVGEPEIPAAEALRQMRELAWSHQLGSMDAGEDGQDLVGGFIFTSARNPLPSAQSSRLLSVLALMAGDPRLTSPDGVMGEIVKLLAGVGFLHDLSVDETIARLFPAPQRAIGGIRLSPWDQRMPSEATSMALVAVCQFRRTADSVRGPQVPADIDRDGLGEKDGQEKEGEGVIQGREIRGLDILLPVAAKP